jgi:hypothetical protein
MILVNDHGHAPPRTDAHRSSPTIADTSLARTQIINVLASGDGRWKLAQWRATVRVPTIPSALVVAGLTSQQILFHRRVRGGQIR